jgi:hypothetical protein
MASVCEAAPWMANDERIPVWERRYALLVDQIQRQDDTEEFSGSPLSMTAR